LDKRDTSTKQYSSIVLRITILFLAAVISVSPVWARSSTEIGQDIINKEKEIAENQQKLAQSAANKERYASDAANLAQGIPQLEAQIKQLEEELTGLNLEISILEQEQALKELEKEQTQFAQNQTIKGSYMDWKSTSHDVRMFVDESVEFSRIQQYQSAMAGNNKVTIDNLTGELVKIEGQMATLNTKKAEVEAKANEVAEQKRQLEERLAQLRWGIGFEEGNIVSLARAVDQASSDITALSNEQRAAIQREQEILQANPGVTNSAGCDGIAAGANSFYFCGNGRDLYQGHGVGMSQFGAKGAAEKGATAKQILEFYYQGATVSSISEPANITVKYCQGNANLAETYNNCNYGGQNYGPVITEQVSMEDYLSGLAEMSSGWPNEARKAQIIAARTYALKRTNNGDPNTPICLTASCQVSKVKAASSIERERERQNAKDTVGQVVTYSGQLIDAMYSADNSQNHGTANCGTRFQDIYGNPNWGCYPYLSSVDDNHWAWDSRLYASQYCGSYACGLWPWKTRVYTYAEFDQFLNWVGLSLYGEFYSAHVTVGKTNYINFERDPSGRISKILIYGDKGSYTLGGWWFKNAWISWVNASGTYDYIYSQTLNVVQNN
jgi:SpoIID/LytB domain protein